MIRTCLPRLGFLLVTDRSAQRLFQQRIGIQFQRVFPAEHGLLSVRRLTFAGGRVYGLRNLLRRVEETRDHRDSLRTLVVEPSRGRENTDDRRCEQADASDRHDQNILHCSIPCPLAWRTRAISSNSAWLSFSVCANHAA